MLQERQDYISNKMGYRVFLLTGKPDPMIWGHDAWTELDSDEQDSYKQIGMLLYNEARSIRKQLKKGL